MEWHLLAGRKLASSEEQEAHVRIAGAFETPDTLASLTQFLRQKGLDLQAKAMLAVVPKAAVAFPRVRTPGCAVVVCQQIFSNSEGSVYVHI